MIYGPECTIKTHWSHIYHILTWNHFEYCIFDLYSNNLEKNKFPINGMCRFFKNCDHSLKFHTQFYSQVNYIQFLFPIIWFNSKIFYNNAVTNCWLNSVKWFIWKEFFAKTRAGQSASEKIPISFKQLYTYKSIFDWLYLQNIKRL